jgi:hypothetical protein
MKLDNYILQALITSVDRFGNEHRTRMLRALEAVETRRLFDCFNVLNSYQRSVLKIAHATYNTATKMSEQLSTVDTTQQIQAFAIQASSTPSATRENMYGYPNRLELPLQVFGVTRSFETPSQWSRHAHRNQSSLTPAAKTIVTRQPQGHKKAASQAMMPKEAEALNRESRRHSVHHPRKTESAHDKIQYL